MVVSGRDEAAEDSPFMAKKLKKETGRDDGRAETEMKEKQNPGVE